MTPIAIKPACTDRLYMIYISHQNYKSICVIQITSDVCIIRNSWVSSVNLQYPSINYRTSFIDKMKFRVRTHENPEIFNWNSVSHATLFELDIDESNLILISYI